MRRSLLGISTLGLLAMLATGCGDTSGDGTGSAATDGGASTGPKKYRIAVIPKGTLHEFWKSIHAGALKAQQELGNVEIDWRGPVKEDDKDQQIQVVETFINDQVDAIVLAPLDKTALRNPVRQAKERNIPVVIVDSGLDYDNIDSYIATDNYNGGAIAAKEMGRLLDGKGNIVVLRYQTGSASTEQREQGFLETLAKEFPEIKVLSENQESGATREGALAKAENLLTTFGSEIDGWFCPCEPVTLGTIKAIANKGMAGKIKVVGFDSTPEVVRSLREGALDGVVLQDPVNMGYLGVMTAVAALEGRPVEKKISTGEYLITPENMDEARNRELHSPDLTKWLPE